MSKDDALNAVELATELTIAWLGNRNNRAAAEEVPAFLRTMHATITSLARTSSGDIGAAEQTSAGGGRKPAVSVRKSLSSKDHIISLIDGKAYKSLRRHLSSHGLTPGEYRERYNLKSDYPMVAENLSMARREVARRIGLGQKGRQPKHKSAAAASAATTPKRSRKSG